MADKKKTISQHIVNLATPGLPKTAKNVIASRWGARFTLGSLVALACSGVISVKWEHGRPRVSINRERIAQIRSLAGQASGGISDQINARRQQTGGSATLPVSAEGGLKQRLTKLASSRHADSSNITIASFNIQVFGTSKTKDPEVMEVLAKTVRRFDVVAIQELRTTDPAVMKNFVQLINAQGGTYQCVVGPRLGRSNSKEQYVFVFDASRVEIDPSSVITVDDPKDLLHREPLVARFRTRVAPPTPPFSFILVNIHTDPDETKTELDALGQVFQSVQRNAWGEDDVILLGDLNVSHQKLGLLGQVPNITYTVHGEPTNTRGTKSYDNIVFSRVATAEYTGQSGILNLESEYGLSKSQALKVSDHMPIWGQFRATEAGGPTRFASQQQPSPAQPPAAQPQYAPAAQPQYTPAAAASGPNPVYSQPAYNRSAQPVAVPGQQMPVAQPAPGTQQAPPAEDPNAPRRRLDFRRARRIFGR